MFNKIKKFSSFVFAMMIALSCTATVFAADDELIINSDATVNVGDKITFSMYLSDCTEPVQGIQMYICYDKEFLTVDPDSMKYEKFDGVIQNPNLDNYVTFNWTNVIDLADFSKKAMLVSVDFEVIKGGETEISDFIQELYGSDMTYLKSYKLSYGISVNGKDVVSDKTPIVNADENIINNHQGAFINYEDGMGENNSPNKDNHQAVKGKIENGTQIVSNVVDVTKTVDVPQGDNSNSVTFIVIAAAAVVVLAIIAVMVVKKKDNPTETQNNEYDESLNDKNDDEN